MRIMFVADGRSAIALNWIRYFVEAGDEVILASTFPCEGLPGLAALEYLPVALSQAKGKMAGPGSSKKGRGIWAAWLVGPRTKLRQWLGPLTVPDAGRRLTTLIERHKPDLLHAMRIPYEGMVAQYAAEYLKNEPYSPPLLISVWGNDFTLHAPANRLMRNLTIRSMLNASALHTDCQRDLRLAQHWGWDAKKPSVVLPGAGGIQLDQFYPPASEADRLTPLVINPRGFRAYVRNDTFFKAAALVLAQRPQTRFVCPGMAGEAQAQRWLVQLKIRAGVELLPAQTRPQMADLFRQAQVAVSPSTHDGTPNTLLEAMACGCYPIAGDLESLREWITPGENGALFDPADPHALAQAILQALDDPAGRATAARLNHQSVLERAEYGAVMARACAFYHTLTGSSRS